MKLATYLILIALFCFAIWPLPVWRYVLGLVACAGLVGWGAVDWEGGNRE